MKKYITIAALLAAGTACANAETLAEIDTADESLVAYWDFDKSSDPTKGTGWTSLPVWNKDGYGVCPGAPTAGMYTSTAGLSAKTGYTVSFDVKNVKNGTLLSIGVAGSGDWKVLDLTYSDGTLSAKFRAGTAATTTLSNESNLNEWTTLTLVGRAKEENTTFILDFYMNGALVGTKETSGATNMVNNATGSIQFGRLGDANSGASMDIDNILVYNKAMTADEVKALTVAVPEPSAFGLLAGIGALALVASRRRRK